MHYLVRRATSYLKRSWRRLTKPALSAVIPVHNGQASIERAIRSVLNQGVADVEVLVVDDASTDNTVNIVRKLASRDPRMRLFQLSENRGPGAARNIGVEKARGKYLTFVDADDHVLKDVYGRLLNTIESTGSDFVSGGYRRTGATGWHRPDITRRVHKDTHLAATLDSFPWVLEEPVLWNKIYRTSFWRDKVGPIPEDRNYEDQEPAIRAATYAATFDVVDFDVYSWSLPEGRETRSQSKRTLEDLRSRIVVMRELLKLAERMPDAGKKVMQATMLGRDLSLYLQEVPYTQDEYWKTLKGLIQELLAAVPEETLWNVPAAARLLTRTAAYGSRDDVETLLGAFQEFGQTVPWRFDKGNWSVGAEFLERAPVELPTQSLRPSPLDWQVVARTWAVNWEANNALSVSGVAGVLGVRPKDWGSRRIRLESATGTVVWSAPLPTVSDDWANIALNETWTSQTHSGFSTVIPLPDGTRESFKVSVEVVVGDRSLVARLEFPQRDHPPVTPPRSDAKDHYEAIRSPEGLLVLQHQKAQPPRAPEKPLVELTETSLNGDIVSLTGTVPSDHAKSAPELFLESSKHSIGIPVVVNDGRWEASFDLGDAALPSEGFFLKWGEARESVSATREVVEGRPLRLEGSSRSLTVAGHGNKTGVTLGPPLTNRERSRYGRHRLSTAPPPPPRNAIVFDTFTGKSAGDNPLAVFEQIRDGRLDSEIQRALPSGVEDWEMFWSVTDGTQTVPDGVERIYVGSERWFDVIRAAKLLVTNNHLPAFFDKSPHQFWLQTWHGTPLKKLLFDAPRETTSLQYRRLMERQSSQWDLLLAQDEQAAENLSSGSRYRGRTLVVEQPRNARLFKEGLRESVRSELGLAPTDNVVLYAPTWRQEDVQLGQGGQHLLDTQHLADETGSKVLVRLHHMVPYGALTSEVVIDVSDYPRVEDLMVASDALISDYSSIFFDYALLGQPMICYASDKGHYATVERGFWRLPESIEGVKVASDESSVFRSLKKLGL